MSHIFSNQQSAYSQKRSSERGIALFYIIVAVALLAALTGAITNSMRGGGNGNIESERARILAGELIDYAEIVSKAVGQLRLRGVSRESLCFDDTAWGVNDYDHAGCTNDLNKLYHPTGAALTWDNAPSDAMSATGTPDNLWHFYGDNAIQDIGTTCAAADCADLILVVDELNRVVCEEINDLLDFPNPATIPSELDMGETRFVGAYGYTSTIGDAVTATDLVGRTSGCFLSGTEYTFYRVLVAR